MYASVEQYIQEYGLIEAVQLLNDEDNELTLQLLKDWLDNRTSGHTAEQTKVLAAVITRLESMLEQQSQFMNGYLRQQVNLPLSTEQIAQTPIRTCCLELTRFQLADDCDNGTEAMQFRYKRWLVWLDSVSKGHLQLLDATSSSDANVHVGTMHTNYRWGDF